MYCYACGAQLPEGTKFCASCGADQVNKQKGAQMAGVDPVAQKKRRKQARNLMLGPILLFILILVLFGIVSVIAGTFGAEHSMLMTGFRKVIAVLTVVITVGGPICFLVGLIKLLQK